MAETGTFTPKPFKRRRPLRKFMIFIATLVVLLVAAYCVVTSSAFLRVVVLPHAGAALNSTITVGDASLHPFTGIVLHDFKLQPNGGDPLVTASEVRASYHLIDIIRGNIHVDEVSLVSPVIQLVQNADGTSNLDPLLKALQAKPGAEKPPAPSKPPSGPLQIDIGKVSLSNADIRQIKNYDAGHRDLTEVTNINITLSNLKNGQQAKMELAADLQMTNNPPTGATGSLAASLNGSLAFALTADLKPGTVQGKVTLAVSQASGVFGNFNALGAGFDCDITPTDIKQLALHFQQGSTPLGQLSVTGPFDAEKMEGKLDLELQGIDRRLLNLAGTKSGIDFGSTTFGAGAQVQLAKAGAEITVNGRVDAGKVQLTRAGQTTPALDFNAKYDVTVDRTAQTATLRSVDLTGTQGGQQFLNAQLDSPMNLAWGSNAGGVGDAAFKLAVTGFNLADWRPFLGNTVSAGTLGLKLDVAAHQSGQQIVFDLNTDLANVAARVGSNELSQATIHLAAQGTVAQFKQVAITNYTAQLVLASQPAVSLSGSATNDLATGNADLQLKLQAALVPLLGAFPQPGMTVSSGNVSGDLACQYQPQGSPSVKGNIQVSKLMVTKPGQTTPPTPLDIGLQVDAALAKQVATVRQLVVALTPTERATNQLQLSGRVDFTKSDALQGDFKLTANSLDFTHYYDSFTGGTNAAAKAAAAPAPAAAPANANANQEPPPVRLPLKDFTLVADIGAIYLHEVIITNFQTTVRIDQSHVAIKPFQMKLNDSPVDATVNLDLSQPGYQYQVAFNADLVPVAPLVNSFEPARAGQMQGALSSHAQINGAGVTGASLQKNLTGTFDLNLTNLDLSVVNVQSRLLKLMIDAVATIPELISSPESAVISLAGSITGQGGLTKELQQAPIDAIAVQANAGQGQVNLKTATVQSSAFQVNASGTVALDAVLTNSTINIPVTVSLSQSIAKKLNLTSANTVTNGAYTLVPPFLTMTGTLGNPQRKIDKMALAGLAVHSLTGNLLNPGTNGTPVNNAVNAVKGLLNNFGK